MCGEGICHPKNKNGFKETSPQKVCAHNTENGKKLLKPVNQLIQTQIIDKLEFNNDILPDESDIDSDDYLLEYDSEDMKAKPKKVAEILKY